MLSVTLVISPVNCALFLCVGYLLCKCIRVIMNLVRRAVGEYREMKYQIQQINSTLLHLKSLVNSLNGAGARPVDKSNTSLDTWRTLMISLYGQILSKYLPTIVLWLSSYLTQKPSFTPRAQANPVFHNFSSDNDFPKQCATGSTLPPPLSQLKAGSNHPSVCSPVSIINSDDDDVRGSSGLEVIRDNLMPDSPTNLSQSSYDTPLHNTPVSKYFNKRKSRRGSRGLTNPTQAVDFLEKRLFSNLGDFINKENKKNKENNEYES